MIRTNNVTPGGYVKKKHKNYNNKLKLLVEFKTIQWIDVS